MRIVLTRHPQQAGELEAGLRQAGYEVAFMPLTQQVLPEDPTELGSAIESLKQGKFSWLILTSGNTVRALCACGWGGGVPEQTQVGVVGPGTARVLEELTGLRNSWIPQDHSAAGILAEFSRPSVGEPPHLLLPQSARARPQLVTGLREMGWDVTHVVAYQTVALRPEQEASSSGSLQLGPPADTTCGATVLTPDALKNDDAVLVTSSTAAEQWAARGPGTQVRLLAIGDPTSETLRRLGTPADQVLTAPTADGVLTCLEE